MRIVTLLLSICVTTLAIQCNNDGSYLKNTGDTICSSCEAGKYNRFDPTASFTTCILCSIGSYQPNVGSRGCNDCDKGKYADIAGASTCLQCPFRTTTYSISSDSVERGMSNCVLCPNGKYIDDTNECVLCSSPGKTFCNNGYEKNCSIPVPERQYASKTCDLTSDALLLPCKTCAKNEYKNGICSGAFDTNCAKCSQCTESQYVFSECSATKDTVCSPCNSSAGDMMVGSGKCSQCPIGSRLSDQGNDCVLCADGTYNAVPNSTTCTLCADGFISGTGASRCVKRCENGYYSPNGHADACIEFKTKFKAVISAWDPNYIQVSASAPVTLRDNQVSYDYFLVATKKPFNYASEIRLLTSGASWSVAGNIYPTTNIEDGKGDKVSFALITSITESSSKKMQYLLTEYDAAKNIGYLQWLTLTSVSDTAVVKQLQTVAAWVRPECAVYDAWREEYLVMDTGVNTLMQIKIDENALIIVSSVEFIYNSPTYGLFNPISMAILKHNQHEGKLIVLDNKRIVSIRGILDTNTLCGGGWKQLPMVEGSILPCAEVDFSLSGAKRVLLSVIDGTDTLIVYVLLTSSKQSAIALITSGSVSIYWLIASNEETTITSGISIPIHLIPTFSSSSARSSGVVSLLSLYLVESTGVISRLSGGSHAPGVSCLCDEGLYCDANTQQCLDAPLGTYTEGSWASEPIACDGRTKGVFPGGSGKSAVCKECPIGYTPNSLAFYCRPSCAKGSVYDVTSEKCLANCNGMYHDTLRGKCADCWLGSEATGGEGIESCIPCTIGNYGITVGVCAPCPLSMTTWRKGSTICMPEPQNTLQQKRCADGLQIACPSSADISQLVPEILNASHITASTHGVLYAFSHQILYVMDTVSLTTNSIRFDTRNLDDFGFLQVCDSCEGTIIFHASKLGTCVYKSEITTSKFSTQVFKGNCGLEGQVVNGLLPKIHSITLMETDTVSPILYISTLTLSCVEVLTISTYDGTVTYFATQDALKSPISLLNTCLVSAVVLASSKGTNGVLYAALNDKLYATQVTGVDSTPERFLKDEPILQVGGLTKIISIDIQHKSSAQAKHHMLLITESGKLHSIPVSASTPDYMVTTVVPDVFTDDILLIGRRALYIHNKSVYQILLSNVNGCVGGFVIPSTDKSIQGICLQAGRGEYTDYDGVLQSCPSGTYGDKSGAALLVHCLTCPDGTIAPFHAHASCQSCPPGSFSDPLHVACVSSCPLGTYRSMNSCVSCQPGYTTQSQDGVCIPCTEGTYSSASTSWQCISCDLGYTSPKGAHNCVKICSAHDEDTCAMDGEHCISLSKQYKVLSQIFTSNSGQQMVGLAVDKKGGVFYTNGYNIRYYFDDCASYLDVCNKEGEDLLQANKYLDYSFSALAICNKVVNGCGTMYSRTLYISSVTYSSVFTLQVCQDSSGRVDVVTTLTGSGLTLLAGSRWAGFADGPFTSAIFNQPADLEINAQCDLLYLSDFLNHKI